MKPSITTAEILNALELATRKMPAPDDAFTFAELLEATGWGQIQARAKLHTAKKAGRLVAMRVQRENIMGALQAVPAYRILPDPAKKKRTR